MNMWYNTSIANNKKGRYNVLNRIKVKLVINEIVPHYLYVIQSNDAIKIGITHNLQQRFNDLQGANPVELQLIYAFKFDSRGQAEALETLLHERFAQYQIHGEWFVVDHNKVLEDVEFGVRFYEAMTEKPIDIHLPTDSIKLKERKSLVYMKNLRSEIELQLMQKRVYQNPSYTKRMDAKEVIKAFFGDHPEHMTTRLDDLVSIIESDTGVKVGRTSIHNVRKQMAD